MRSTKLDSTLESNLITAYVPRFPVFDRITHLAENVFCTLRKIFCCYKPGALPLGLRPPGDVASLTEAEGFDDLKRLTKAERLTFPSRETWGNLPTLTPEEANRARTYLKVNRFSFQKSTRAEIEERNDLLNGIEDAFSEAELPAEKDGAQRFLLPHTVRQSTLLNKGYPEEGEIDHDATNTLIDRSTGFAASIAYDRNRREVIISFAPPLTHNMRFRQSIRTFLQWLGFIPKPFSQASKLTRLVKEHLEALNAELPPDKKIQLTLTGFCAGGAMASYAALRNKVPAIVANPFRLGNGLRARIGEVRLQEAHKYLTEIVVQRDLVSDNPWAWVYWPLRLIGINSFGPLGTATRFIIPHSPPDEPKLAPNPHLDFVPSLAFLPKVYHTILSLKRRCPWLRQDELDKIYHARGRYTAIQELLTQRLGPDYQSANPRLFEALTDYLDICCLPDKKDDSLRKTLTGVHEAVLELQKQGKRVPEFCMRIIEQNAQQRDA